jgi:uncharacterized protein YjeT (DUF2065 family)
VSALLLAVGGALAIEGLLYAAFPGAMQDMMRRLQDMPPATLRTFGLVALATGVFVVWLAT